MKQAKALIPLLQDRVLQDILTEIVAELDRQRNLPPVSSVAPVDLRNAINRITGKI